jgi:hypothetical protein
MVPEDRVVIPTCYLVPAVSERTPYKITIQLLESTDSPLTAMNVSAQRVLVRVGIGDVSDVNGQALKLQTVP